MGKLIVKFAEEQWEKEQVYQLRYSDLILEYRKENVNEEMMDITKHDEYAKLVVCIDEDEKLVVGSYRIITSDDVGEGRHFVTEEEFDISWLKSSGEKVAELSRAVIRKEYRGSLALMLILRFIFYYLKSKGYRYVIGEASFFGTDKMALQQQISYIAYNHYNPDYHVPCLDKEQVEILPKEQLDFATIRRSLPILIRAYVSFGAFLSKDVFTDYDFGDIDTFVLLDFNNCNQRYIDKFLGK